MSIAFFTDTGVLNGEANGDGTLATVISIVYRGRSRLYTSGGYGSYGDFIPRALQALGMINHIATYTSVYFYTLHPT